MVPPGWFFHDSGCFQKLLPGILGDGSRARWLWIQLALVLRQPIIETCWAKDARLLGQLIGREVQLCLENYVVQLGCRAERVGNLLGFRL